MENIKKAGLLIGPLVFIAIWLFNPLNLNPVACKTLALTVFMVLWWITEAVPIYVTALFPVLFFPLLGISDIKEATGPYGSPVIFLFLGGFILALAIEKMNLHKRIALQIIKFTGSSPNKIILGFMLSTALLSMWLSNTATAVMMLPISLSVIHLLSDSIPKTKENIKGLLNFSLCMMLAICYGANIGGTATLIGTPPNLVLLAYMEETFQLKIGFGKWMSFALPFAVLLLFISYLLLVKVLFPNKLPKFASSTQLISDEIQKLGPLSKGEKRVAVIFSATALLWIFRGQLNKLPGWERLDDAGIAILAAVILFIVPANWKKNEFILKWNDTFQLPWGILFLFGGGLSLAAGLEKVGLLASLGQFFQKNGGDNPLIIIILLTLSAVFITEVMSNVALVTVFVPVVAGIAQASGVNPFLLTIPITLGASCAFMLPMSTPPNAIVFGGGHISIHQMAKAGLLINLVSVLLISILGYFFLPLIF